MPPAAIDHSPTVQPGSLRSETGRGRPYPPEIVAAVRALLEGTTLRFGEIAGRTGVGEATVGRWARRFHWGRAGRREEVTPAGVGVSHLGRWDANPLPGGERSSRRSRPGEGESALRRVRNPLTPTLSPPGRGSASRRPGRYEAEDHAAARALIEGSRLGLERIGLTLGIGTATLFRWQRRYRWTRPAPPDKAGPTYFRYRSRGRPYAADAVGTARDLVTGTLLSQKRIAARAGVSQASISKWIRRRGWTRPADKPGSRRVAASRRTAPTAESGSRRGRPYGPATVAEARRLYTETELSTDMVAARVRVSPVTIALWARTNGWTRPRELLDPHGHLVAAGVKLTRLPIES